MLFWIICGVLAVVVGGMVVAPMLRAPARKNVSPDVVFYRSQLEELDRDITRGVVDPSEAGRSKVEISRRLLSADLAMDSAGTDRPTPRLAVIIAIAISVAGVAGYYNLGAAGYGDLPLKARLAAADDMRINRPSQAAMEAAAPAPGPVNVAPDYLASIAQLRALVPTRGNDVQGWELLAFHEAQLRNYTAAASAQSRVIAMKGTDASRDDTRRLLDLTVMAAGGLVSPEAEVQARALFDLDAADPVARYYLGALYYQTDRSDVALRMWAPIVAQGDPQAYHTAAARSQIEDAAFRAGAKYTLPPERGPTAQDIANATDMTAQDRDTMIRSMVTGLASRLANQGGPAADWAQLIAAYGVLGETAAATEIWLEARDVFAGSASAIDTLRTAATNAGVAQ
jgi:cytochrome c-type biogenesis protein CcmH